LNCDLFLLCLASSGGVPPRGSPTLATSVEEAEKAKVFERIQNLPPNIRLPFESMLNGSSMNVANRYCSKLKVEFVTINK
jgi:hypothetical protein